MRRVVRFAHRFAVGQSCPRDGVMPHGREVPRWSRGTALRSSLPAGRHTTRTSMCSDSVAIPRRPLRCSARSNVRHSHIARTALLRDLVARFYRLDD